MYPKDFIVPSKIDYEIKVEITSDSTLQIKLPFRFDLLVAEEPIRRVNAVLNIKLKISKVGDDTIKVDFDLGFLKFEVYDTNN